MPFSFPSSPTIGQEAVQNGRTYRWTGAAWELVSQIQGHTHAAGDITSGTFAPARLGSGVASNATFLRGDGTWATVIQTNIDGGSATTSDGGVVDGGSATTV